MLQGRIFLLFPFKGAIKNHVFYVLNCIMTIQNILISGFEKEQGINHFARYFI